MKQLAAEEGNAMEGRRTGRGGGRTRIPAGAEDREAVGNGKGKLPACEGGPVAGTRGGGRSAEEAVDGHRGDGG